MSRTLTTAAVRLDNTPAPRDERLRAVEAQVVQAAAQGAQLIVLPEVFNTGYVYSNENYTRAEPIDGPTVTWLKRLAAERGLHVAGSLLLRGPAHITNSLLLVAPDGRLWRYDKNHPWVWERAYFREGRDITVAHTDLGSFGLMICIDVLASSMYRRYAGQVDALIVSASPPRMHELMFHFPDGGRVSLAALMGFTAAQRAISDEVFGAHVRRLAAWMGVPVIQATPYGQFETTLPVPWLSWAVLLARKPSLWRYYLKAGPVTGRARYYDETWIADARGEVLDRYDAAADGFALATLNLADRLPQPADRFPGGLAGASWLSWLSDSAGWLLIPAYRRGVRRAWGRHMAPVDAATRDWSRGVVLAGLLGFLLGRLGRRQDPSP